GKTGENRGRHRAGVRARIEDAVGAPNRLQPLDRDPAPVARGPPKRERHTLLLVRRVPARGHPQQPLAAERLGGPPALPTGGGCLSSGGMLGGARLLASFLSTRSMVGSQITVTPAPG